MTTSNTSGLGIFFSAVSTHLMSLFTSEDDRSWIINANHRFSIGCDSSVGIYNMKLNSNRILSSNLVVVFAQVVNRQSLKITPRIFNQQSNRWGAHNTDI